MCCCLLVDVSDFQNNDLMELIVKIYVKFATIHFEQIWLIIF